MKWKTTLILIIATVGIGTYISLYELKQPSIEQAKLLAKHVVSVPSESVTKIDIEILDTDITLFQDDKTWRFFPEGLRANPDLIDQMLRQTDPLISGRTLTGLDDQPLDPAEYGLDPAVGTITLRSDESDIEILFGEKTAVANNRYVKLADRPEIFIVSGRFFNLINQPNEEFRDPLLIRLTSWTADELTVRSPQVNYTLLRSEDKWHLTQPIKDLADKQQVDFLLNQLGSLNIERVVENTPNTDQLSEWGLDEPGTEITLIHDDRTVTTTIAFGNPISEDEAQGDSPDAAGKRKFLTAKRSDEEALYAIDKNGLDVLLEHPGELRDKKCFRFFTSNVKKIEMDSQSLSWIIERLGGAWKDADSQALLETERVEALLNELADIEIGDFVNDAPSGLQGLGLKPPFGTISIWISEEDIPQKLRVGNIIGDSANRYGRIEGRNVLVELPDIFSKVLEITIEDLMPVPDKPTQDSSPNAPE